MARTDAMVLGGGIVGVSVALQLARRGLCVALVERAGVGEQTSYGNSGVIEGSTVLPPAFPSSFSALTARRPQARERSQLSSVVPAAGGALAHWPFAPPRSQSGSSRPRGSTARCLPPLSPSTRR